MISPCGDEIVMMNSVYKERFPKVRLQLMVLANALQNFVIQDFGVFF